MMTRQEVVQYIDFQIKHEKLAYGKEYRPRARVTMKFMAEIVLRDCPMSEVRSLIEAGILPEPGEDGCFGDLREVFAFVSSLLTYAGLAPFPRWPCAIRCAFRHSSWQAASSRSPADRLLVTAVIRASKRSRSDRAGGLASGSSKPFGVVASTSQIATSVARFGSRSPVA